MFFCIFSLSFHKAAICGFWLNGQSSAFERFELFKRFERCGRFKRFERLALSAIEHYGRFSRTAAIFSDALADMAA
jgi:hypothetical protein